MSLVQEIAETVRNKGQATSDELGREFPDKTPQQIYKALRNARDRGMLELAKPGESLGRGKGRAPGVYRAPTEKPRMTPSVNSVWSMAA